MSSTFNLSDTLNRTPNFTILVPGMCRASCDFCFWNRKDGQIKPPADYLDRLCAALLSLPGKYRSISVSGGEPTESGWLIPILRVIAAVRLRRSFDRVILTTNGSRLSDILAFNVFGGGFVDYVNISHHHYDDAVNTSIFKDSHIPNSADLQAMIEDLSSKGIPVRLNCVINDETDEDFIFSYANFASKIGASSVSFRKEASTITPTPVEDRMVARFGAGESNNCPVCRGRPQTLLGYSIGWKGSVAEPSIAVGKTYEAIFHPDGVLYADWSRKHPLEIPQVIPAESHEVPAPKTSRIVVEREYRSGPSHGCGSSGC